MDKNKENRIWRTIALVIAILIIIAGIGYGFNQSMQSLRQESYEQGASDITNFVVGEIQTKGYIVIQLADNSFMYLVPTQPEE